MTPPWWRPPAAGRGPRMRHGPKSAVLAEMFARRTGLAAGERELWWIDPQAAVAAEMGAAVNVSQGMALHQTHRGVALRDRLPKVARLFEAGVVVGSGGARHRAAHVPDHRRGGDGRRRRRTGRPDHRLGALSVAKTEAAIDALVEQHDPGALRRSRESASGHTVEFGSPPMWRAPPACGPGSMPPTPR